VGSHKQALGSWGEEQAARYLERLGYIILERNYRSPAGEVDLVAAHIDRGESYLVFVEVKTRTTSRYGYPESAVTRRKWEHLLGAAAHYLDSHPLLDGNWRVDVIAVLKNPVTGPPQITHFENVVFHYGQD
jgi:putative endonuclease